MCTTFCARQWFVLETQFTTQGQQVFPLSTLLPERYNTPYFKKQTTQQTQQVVNTQRPITSVLATTHFLVAGGPLGFVLLFDLKKEEVIWEGTIKGTCNSLLSH